LQFINNEKFLFSLQTIKSLSSNIESLKKEVELAAMAAKSKESPSQARQIVSTNSLAWSWL